jgi:NADH:ubiquinone oxidoreductase subunit E
MRKKLAGTFTFSSCNKRECMSRGEYNLFLYSLNKGALHVNQYTNDTDFPSK